MSKIKNILYAFTFAINMIVACGEGEVPYTKTREAVLAEQGWTKNSMNFGNLRASEDSQYYPKPFVPELSAVSRILTVTADVLSKEVSEPKSNFVIGSPILFLNVSPDGSKILQSIFTVAGECAIRDEYGRFVTLLSEVLFGKNSVQISVYTKDDSNELVQSFLTGVKQSKDVFLRALTWDKDEIKVRVLQNGPNWDSAIAKCSNAVLKTQFEALTYVAPAGIGWAHLTGGQQFADDITNLYFDPDGTGNPVGSLRQFADKPSPDNFSVDTLLRAIPVSSIEPESSKRRLGPDVTTYTVMELFRYELKDLPHFTGVVNRDSPRWAEAFVSSENRDASNDAFITLHRQITSSPIGTTFNFSDIFPELSPQLPVEELPAA